MSEAEKQKKRAEKFGLPLDETDKKETDKKAARAAKFGLPLEGDKSEKDKKIAARAERFKGELDTAIAKPGKKDGKVGAPATVVMTAEEEEKRKKRAARFGDLQTETAKTETAKDSAPASTDPKILAREKRFKAQEEAAAAVAAKA